MIKDNLKKIRQELKLSISKFSEVLEIPAPTLTCYERGERTPSAQLFIQLDKKLNVNLNWLVSGCGDMFKTAQNFDANENIEKIIYNTMLQILKNNGIV